MKRLLPVLIALLPLCTIAEDMAPPTEPAAAPITPEQETLLKQAFDGAMTCSALTALKGDQVMGEAQQQWVNRSFAFGMLAVRFYTDLKSEPLSNDELNNALNQYADALTAMSEEELAPFETGCGNKYADMDRLCEENDCVFPRKGAPPGEENNAPAE